MPVLPPPCHPHPMLGRTRILPLLCAAACAAIPGLPSAAAEAPVPYAKDDFTLHLWHLDETRAPFADAGPSPVPLRGLLNGAFAGQASLPGLGTSISLRASAGGTPGESNLAGAILAEAPRLVAGSQDNVAKDFRYFGADGAFTYEMLVKPEILPMQARTIALGLRENLQFPDREAGISDLHHPAPLRGHRWRPGHDPADGASRTGGGSLVSRCGELRR